MKKVVLGLLAAIFFTACGNDNDDIGITPDPEVSNYRDAMREFVIGISQKAHIANPGFIVIPQNGIELVSTTGEPNGAPHTDYLNAISGNGQEDFLYGYDNDDQATPASVTSYLKGFLDLSKNAGKTILTIDYCSAPSKMSESYTINNSFGYVSFAASERSLTIIPAAQPNNVNSNVITTLSEAKNFLYIINPENFTTKADFITAVSATNYDAVIMDLFINDEEFTAAEIAQLKNKANGGKRLIISYMSIGEAEDYRYYWNSSWSSAKPDWVAAENPDWPGNFKVKYWNQEWQGIIYKNYDSYLDKITAAGFDGVYLDIIDAFEYFEQ
ncbi:endo alpha-1,4 polygalactosaminidase [Flavobacterium sp. DG1-102-2]|uniref:endo alpha-1,4 polygalactosaminidase n=1 Tax=Flavobacterium sp. DG1-102-2 TaxID=3081663 RepID=UPI002948C983|nr:endo alpha-1,4 polygalactosaminidase [Flavobacterium sp. DG1-102-2]MDV6166793.1 endo alpha-1,4 polygalactosaminidase [Flavobacterium sp. DG1-102-2]